MTSRIAPLLTVAIATQLVAAPVVTAHEDLPLYAAASEYREAVRDFERSVFRSRYLTRVQERAADDLEDATARLRSAARRPERFDRLWPAWLEVQSLHSRAAAIVFADPNCPSRWELADRWNAVEHAYGCVAREITACHRNPIYPSLGRHHVPAVTFPPAHRVPATVPVAPRPKPPRLPVPPAVHPSQWNPNRGQIIEPFWIQAHPADIWQRRTSVPQRQASPVSTPLQVGARFSRATR